MSHVDTLLLSFSLYDDAGRAALHRINDWLMNLECSEFARLNERFGGTKHPQHEFYGVALNGANLDAVLKAIFTAPWDMPQHVVVLLNREHEEGVVIVTNGNWMMALETGE